MPDQQTAGCRPDGRDGIHKEDHSRSGASVRPAADTAAAWRNTDDAPEAVTRDMTRDVTCDRTGDARRDLGGDGS
jgi:hypothetical protein